MAEERRKPWVAALLSVVFPGLGQVYTGRVKKGLLLSCLFLVILVASVMVMMEYSAAPLNVIIPFFTVIATFLFILIDAMITAKRFGGMYLRRCYNKWYVYLGAIALVAVVVVPVVRDAVGEAFGISRSAMADTLVPGDYVLLDKFSYGIEIHMLGTWVTEPRMPERGDVIVFEDPDNEAKRFLKRVIGLPGEIVEIRAMKIFIDGNLLDESYLQVVNATATGYPRSSSDAYGPVKIPAGKMFLLGDNLDESQDSRVWGFLDQQKVVGKARRILWSWDPATRRVRWERIGRTIR